MHVLTATEEAVHEPADPPSTVDRGCDLIVPELDSSPELWLG